MRIGSYRVTRKDIDRLMAIPEARMVLEAKFAQVWMLYVGDLESLEKNGPVPEVDHTDSPSTFPNDPKIMRMPFAESEESGSIDDSIDNITRIVDASRFRYASQKEREKIFMKYFTSHLGIRKAVLDEFFMRILPYSSAAADEISP